MISKLSYLLLLPLLLLCACEDDDDPIITLDGDVPDNVSGLNFAEYDNGDFNTLYNGLVSSLEGNFNIGVVAQVNHRDNALSIGTSIPETRVVLFGNPSLGTPIMQANQLAGLDLPQKILTYVADDGDVVMAYNNTDYLAQRYNVGDVATLPMISTALENFATGMGAESINTEDANDIGENEGIIIRTSAFSVDQTFANLETVINGNDALSLIAQLDHQANANSVFMELRPTRLAVFGNPTLGTPLIQDERSIAVDLPQKMLIYEMEDGTVRVAYNDIRFLADRHGVEDDLEQIGMIANALDMIATTITTE